MLEVATQSAATLPALPRWSPERCTDERGAQSSCVLSWQQQRGFCRPHKGCMAAGTAPAMSTNQAVVRQP